MYIVTDGAVDVPDELLASDRFQSVPGNVLLDGSTFQGDVVAFWRAVRDGGRPTTSPPTVEALTASYREGDRVIALHVSSQLSATMDRAKEAASRIGANVTIVDTRSISVGAGLVVDAVHRANATTEPEATIELARTLPDHLHTFALVQDVASLRRSDRAGLLPSRHLTRGHPLVLAVRGRVVALGAPRHRTGALRELVGHLVSVAGGEPRVWALGHGDASDVDRSVDVIATELGHSPAFVRHIDPTVGAHLGPDAIVVGVLSDAPTGNQSSSA